MKNNSCPTYHKVFNNIGTCAQYLGFYSTPPLERTKWWYSTVCVTITPSLILVQHTNEICWLATRWWYVQSDPNWSNPIQPNQPSNLLPWCCVHYTIALLAPFLHASPITHHRIPSPLYYSLLPQEGNVSNIVSWLLLYYCTSTVNTHTHTHTS